MGPDPEDRQFVWLAGQGGFGIMTSPGMARMATSLIIDEELPAWMTRGGLREAEVRPDRLRP